MKKATYFLTFVLMFILVNCNSSYINYAREKSSLLNTPTRVKINGQKYILNAYASYDFLSSLAYNYRGLGGKIVVRSLDGKPVPKTIEVLKVWVINMDSNAIWESEMGELNRIMGLCSDTLRLNKVLRNGPNWKVSSEVKIVVELVDTTTNKIYFLRAAGHNHIDRTY